MEVYGGGGGGSGSSTRCIPPLKACYTRFSSPCGRPLSCSRRLWPDLGARAELHARVTTSAKQRISSLALSCGIPDDDVSPGVPSDAAGTAGRRVGHRCVGRMGRCCQRCSNVHRYAVQRERLVSRLALPRTQMPLGAAAHLPFTTSPYVKCCPSIPCNRPSCHRHGSCDPHV